MRYLPAKKIRPHKSHGVQDLDQSSGFGTIPAKRTIQGMWALCFIITCSILGCGGEGVREDRAIGFSRDGGQVAFQHNEEGVFVANADGKGLTKIFQPDENVLATSRPLSSPKGGRIIFATAQLLENEGTPPPRVIGPQPAEGRIAWQRPIRFTCWLRSEPKGDQPAEVKKLFEGQCGHLGYVSGGLVLRWHPDGRHILYCAAVEQDLNQHSVFEFDLATGKSRRVFPHAATAVICDWTPAGSQLVCVVGSAPLNQESNAANADFSGVWIGLPGDDKSWWHVPGSERLATGQLPSVIEMSRASRPAWTADDSQFAFVSQRAPKDPKDKIEHHLQRVVNATRKITTLAQAPDLFADLHWSPDGKQLGYLQRNDSGRGTLQLVDQLGQITKVPTSDSVRKFAGFDAKGQHIAYVVADHLEQKPGTKHWALLLQSGTARDSVRIASANVAEMAKDIDPGQEIFSGMQVTFPLWSPTEEKLSLWLTFTPRYRSLLSILAQVGMWPGDPAATIEIPSKSIAWMAVSPQEELQIGHYHLLKGDPTEASRWYARAHQKLAPAKPPSNGQDFLQNVGAPEHSQLFEYLCFKRLGRDAAAAAKWLEFEQNFYPAAAKPGEPPTADVFMQILGPQSEQILKPLIRDLFIAEVFLSVEGMNEALGHFRHQPMMPEADAVAFSRAVVLSQLLLISGDHSSYLTHCSEVVAPLALKLWQVDQPDRVANNQALEFVAGLCLTPLFRSEFMETLDPALVRQQKINWEQLALKFQAGRPAVAIDLVLRAMALSLKEPVESKSLEARIAANPASQELFSGKPVDEVTATWTEFGQTQAPAR